MENSRVFRITGVTRLTLDRILIDKSCYLKNLSFRKPFQKICGGFRSQIHLVSKPDWDLESGRWHLRRISSEERVHRRILSEFSLVWKSEKDFHEFSSGFETIWSEKDFPEQFESEMDSPNFHLVSKQFDLRRIFPNLFLVSKQFEGFPEFSVFHLVSKQFDLRRIYPNFHLVAKQFDLKRISPEISLSSKQFDLRRIFPEFLFSFQTVWSEKDFPRIFT